ncbi:alkaline serine protease Alp1 [Cordyceps javanica]|uniref:Alkaline serine protease Alp1 n=1 Tax=Cordyceps javanica TaxID=43265 RepID=A0A545VTN5_9HYPO|nr:alkaline serine protease Alp1 [Cordyceps javanica]TQW05080.1 alkaline serine protease Alp1 [Cordyceps javanica]
MPFSRPLTAFTVLFLSVFLAVAAEQKYIVILKNGIVARSVDSHLAQVHEIHTQSFGRRDLGLPGIENTYSIGDFQGYSGTFDNNTVAKIQDLPEVDVVVLDQPGEKLVLVVQENADYGLASLSSSGPGADVFRYDDTAGKGTFAYVVDWGIDNSHPDFGGRVTQGYSLNGNFDDLDPHGTMVAGALASKTYGVAKNAEIIDVRIAHKKDSLSQSSILNGFNWAIDDIIKRGRVGKAVINVSQDGGAYADSPLNRAVEAAFRLGILTVAAAGNSGWERVDWVTPASAPNALTVGAIDKNWQYQEDSNHGDMIDILAPGDNVLTISSQTRDPVRVTGTSLAAPYVAGIALYLSALEEFRTVQELVDRIKSLATPGKVGRLPANTVNLVASNGGAISAEDNTIVFPQRREDSH